MLDALVISIFDSLSIVVWASNFPQRNGSRAIGVGSARIAEWTKWQMIETTKNAIRKG